MVARTESPRVVQVKRADKCAYDIVSLGEVMLRLDPRDRRIRTTRTFDVWDSGAEYNVARAFRRCFNLRGAIVTAFADNEVGRLLEDINPEQRPGHGLRPLGAVRRRRPCRAQRPELLRARLRDPRRAGVRGRAEMSVHADACGER